MNCQPGDLAVVVRSKTASNVGKIVRVCARYAIGDSHIVSLDSDAVIWLCSTAGSPLRWSNAVGVGETTCTTGPIPDSCLRPLRPPPVLDTQPHAEALALVA